MYTVYQHINKINGKVYIGITKQKPESRWGANGINYNTSPHFYLAIQKYGWENFDHLILFEGLTQIEASEKEKELVKQFNSNNPEFGYNCTNGGELNFELNEIAREKKSKAMLGNKNGCHPCSEETKEKIRQAEKGKPLSEEHKQKLKEAAQTRISPPCSEEKKLKLQNSYPNMKSVYCEETDTIYKSVQECGRQLGLKATNICAVCKGKHKAHKGYHFRYIDNI